MSSLQWEAMGRAMSEADVDGHVRQLARQLRLFAYHTRDSRGSEKGFPDWVIIGPRGILWREDKSAFGKLTPEQRAVGYSLQALGADWDVWRPIDVLSGRVRQEMERIK